MEITITGEVKFRGNCRPLSIPEGSHLLVSFQDVSLMDAPSVKLGETEVDLENYNKDKVLKYCIKCAMPSPIAPDYSVSAVLNISWERTTDSWIRRGDYLSDTMHHVLLKDGVSLYKVDVELIHYQWPIGKLTYLGPDIFSFLFFFFANCKLMNVESENAQAREFTGLCCRLKWFSIVFR